MGSRNPERNNHATLGAAKAQRQELHLRCVQCGRTARADLDVLIAKLGASFTVADITHHVHCRECEARWPYVGWELRADPNAGAGR